MDLVEIVLKVKEDRKECASWILSQDVDIVADALGLCESAYKVLQRNKVSYTYSSNEEEEMKLKQEYEKKMEETLKMYEDDKMRIKKFYKDENDILQEKVNELLNNERRIKEECKEEYKEQIKNVMATSNEQMEYFKEAVKNKDELLKRMGIEKETIIETKNEENRKMSEEYVVKFENMNKLLTGTAGSKGNVGENFVNEVFNNLNLGYLEDTRHKRDETGCEDFLWTQYDEKTKKQLKCSVEVKNRETCLHSKGDILKHQMRISEACNSGKINCGLFLSLQRKIPNTKSIDVKNISGIPVLYISKTESISSSMVVELGFTIMNLIWLNTNMSDANDNTEDVYLQFKEIINKISDLITKQMSSLSLMNKQIEDIDNNANALLKNSGKLKQIRLTMITNISNIQATHPEICSNSNNETTQMKEDETDKVNINELSLEELLNLDDVKLITRLYEKFYKDKKDDPDELVQKKAKFAGTMNLLKPMLGEDYKRLNKKYLHRYEEIHKYLKNKIQQEYKKNTTVETTPKTKVIRSLNISMDDGTHSICSSEEGQQ